MQGTFPYLKVRSSDKQTLPYKPLKKTEQITFELQNVRGTLLRFRLPQYLKGVNQAGNRFHFITSDRKAGGHVLDGTFLNPKADIETFRDWQIMLPDNTTFKQASLE